MDWTGDAIMCSVLPHGEHGAIARLLTPDAGLLAGYVKAGRSTKFRAMLMPGNVLRTEWRMRVESQLGSFTLDMARSRAASLFADRKRSAAIAWATALISATVPERQPYPRIYDGLDALLEIIAHADRDAPWAATLVRFELLVLAELGFGLDLSCCAVTGATESLIYVSPKSARAVSAEAGRAWHDRLLALPAFLLDGRSGAASWSDIHQGLRLTGHFLERQLFADQRTQVLEARQRLVAVLPVAAPAV